MRYKTFLYLFFLPFSLSAQWADYFNTTALDTAWKGQRGFWEQSQGSLQSNGPQISGTCISLIRAIELNDSFELLMRTRLHLATSSNNYLSVYLLGKQRTWQVKLGGTPDEVSLFEDGQLVIDGQDKTLSSSSFNQVGLRLRYYSDSVELAITLGSDTLNWILQGKASVSITELDSLRIEACYSSSNAHSFFIEGLRIGAIQQDTSQPRVLRHYRKSNYWHLFFSEPLDTATAILLSDNGKAISVQWIDGSSLRLAEHATGSTVYFSVLQDLSGNPITANSLTLYDPPLAFRSIQITELMADPNPPVQLPDQEWIELWNASDSFVELSEFSLKDATKQVQLMPYAFPPKSYLLLSDDCTLLQAYGPCMQLDMGASFLNNSGEELALIHRNGDTLEGLRYDDKWYTEGRENGGYSLEKRDPQNPCIPDEENFSSCSNSIGGTPGRANSLDERIVDNIPPLVESLQVLGPNVIQLLFSEPLRHLGWVIFDGDSVSLEEKIPRHYLVELSAPLRHDAERKFTLKLGAQGDCAGNVLSDTSIEFRYALPEVPQRGDLIFTELMFLPSAHYAPFIEVYNRSTKALTFAGTRVGTENAERFFPAHLLFPGESAVLCAKKDTGAFSGIRKLVLSSLPSFSKSGNLWMRNIDGKLIDAMYYSDTFFMDGKANAGAFSLQRHDSLGQCPDVEYWQVGREAGGTPGAQNFSTQPMVKKAIALWHIYPLSPNKLRLTYSHALGEEPPEISINSSGFLMDWQVSGDDFRSWNLTWSIPFLPHTRYTLTQQSGIRCGFMQEEWRAEFSVPGPADGLVINEILYDPIGDEPDYIELMNTGPEAIDLKGMQLASYDAAGTVKGQVEIAKDGYVLLPGHYALITASDHFLGRRFSHYSQANTLIVAQLPSFPNSGMGVQVFDSLGQVVDSFFYDPKMHSSLLDNTEGISLERIDPTLRGNQEGNWISAAAPSNFGTPGWENSQLRRPPMPGKEHWNLVSPSFSPDGDGFEDQAILRYEGIAPGSIAHIGVYALNGLLVAEWANNLPIGTAGQLWWEGNDYFGMPLSDGPYLVLIEWQNPAGKSMRERKILVKATRH